MLADRTLAAKPHLASPPSQPLLSDTQHAALTPSSSLTRSSARLRSHPSAAPDAPTPVAIRQAKPVPLRPRGVPVYPPFPPEGAALHPEDASSKVLLAIGRALLAVDNKAVTIKDLAEMVVPAGLVCQNVSAASQAITTYIRNHLKRCEEENDQPLLNSHTLSGTPSDDDLLPGLHSRTGGAHCAPTAGENRRTNFRKGTNVWYLSKACGAPCPFDRVDLRITDYGENGRIGQAPSTDPRERRRERDRARRAALAKCGKKRKRPSRACNGNGTDDGESASETEGRPNKVKLTLRLKPTPLGSSPPPVSSSPVPSDSEDDDDSMSLSSDDDEDEITWSMSSSLPSSMDSLKPVFPTPAANTDLLRRSPSIPYSVASAPPDSEEEGDDYSQSAHNLHYDYDDYMDDSYNFDADEDEDDEDTNWGESDGPHSPPSTVLEEVVVKANEPLDLDVPSMLARLEREHEIVALRSEAHFVEPSSKSDSFDIWEWEQYGAASPIWDTEASNTDSVPVKQETREWSPELQRSISEGAQFSPVAWLAALTLQSPVEERAEPSFPLGRPAWQDVELLGPEAISPDELDEGEWKPNVVKSRSATWSAGIATAAAFLNSSSATPRPDSTPSLSSSVSSAAPSLSPVASSPQTPTPIGTRSAGLSVVIPDAELKPISQLRRTSLDMDTIVQDRTPTTKKRDSHSSSRTVRPQSATLISPWDDEMSLAFNASLDHDDDVLPSFGDAFPRQPFVIEEAELVPWSPDEQETFQSFCVFPDETVTPTAADVPSPVAPTVEMEAEADIDVEIVAEEEEEEEPAPVAPVAKRRGRPPKARREVPVEEPIIEDLVPLRRSSRLQPVARGPAHRGRGKWAAR